MCSKTKMGADVAASPRFPRLTIAMPRQGHHPLGGWAPRGGANAVSGPRGSRPGREGLGGSLRDEGKAEAWMPKSRFRRSATRSRAPPRFEEAGSNQGKPSSSASPGSAENQGFRLPPRSARTPRKRRLRTAWRPLGEQARRKDRLRDPRLEANPDPRTAGPLARSRSSRSRPVSRPRDRSELRSLEPPDRPAKVSPRHRPVRSAAIEANLDLETAGPPRKEQAPSATTRFATPGKTKRASLPRAAGPPGENRNLRRDPFRDSDIEANLDLETAGPRNASRSLRPKPVREKPLGPKPSLPLTPSIFTRGAGPSLGSGG
jgi:hypothetical protein